MLLDHCDSPLDGRLDDGATTPTLPSRPLHRHGISVQRVPGWRGSGPRGARRQPAPAGLTAVPKPMVGSGGRRDGRQGRPAAEASYGAHLRDLGRGNRVRKEAARCDHSRLAGGLAALAVLLVLLVAAPAGGGRRPSAADSQGRDRWLPSASACPTSAAARACSGLDAPGFTHWVFRRIDVRLPLDLARQMRRGAEVSRDQLKPGDVVYFPGRRRARGHLHRRRQDDRHGRAGLGREEEDDRLVGRQHDAAPVRRADGASRGDARAALPRRALRLRRRESVGLRRLGAHHVRVRAAGRRARARRDQPAEDVAAGRALAS